MASTQFLSSPQRELAPVDFSGAEEASSESGIKINVETIKGMAQLALGVVILPFAAFVEGPFVEFRHRHDEDQGVDIGDESKCYPYFLRKC
jgi:hypothetical protein